MDGERPSVNEETDSPFPRPTMTSVDNGAPPVWAIVIGCISIALILACVFLWSIGK